MNAIDPFSPHLSGRGAPPPQLSVVAPCYNEAGGIAEFHRRVTAAVAAAGFGHGAYEVVLINDGSKDATLEHLRVIAAADPAVVVVNLSRNFGHQKALSAGLRFCRGDRILVIDSDLQDPPELLTDMLALLDQGADVVYGQRLQREGETRFKSLSAALFYRLLRRLVDIEIPLDTGDFRLMRRRVLDVLNDMPEQARFIRGMVSWIGMRQVPIPYERDRRFAGETGYTLGAMLRLALDAVTGFSVTPLRIASMVGLLSAGIGLAMLAYTMGSWLIGSAVTGWTSLASIVLLIGSAQLLVLGVIGEYLGRLFMESKRRPLYVVDEVITGARLPADTVMPR